MAVVVKLTGDIADLDAKLKSAGLKVEELGNKVDDAGSKSGKLSGALSGVSKVAGGLVLGTGIMNAPGFLLSAAQAAADDEAATMRLEQAMKNLSEVDNMLTFDELKGAVDDLIDKGQKLAFSDDEVRDSLQGLMAATGSADESMVRLAAAQDLARGANIPLSTASKMLGKLNEENVEVFKKMGITLGENATEATALAAVQEKFGGQAEAYANSTAGQFEQAKLAMGEIVEGIGSAVLPILTTVGTVLAENMPAIQAFVGELGSGIANVVTPALATLGPLVMQAAAWFQAELLPRIQEFLAWLQPNLALLGEWIATEFAKFRTYYETDIAPALENIKAGIQAVIAFVVENWPQISAVITPVMEQVKLVVETAVQVIMGVLGILIDLIGGDFSGAWNGIKDLIAIVWEAIQGSISNAMALIEGILSGGMAILSTAWGAAWDGIKGLLDTAWENIKTAVSTAIDSLVGFVQALPGRIVDSLGNLGSLLYQAGKDVVQGMIDGILSMAGEAMGAIKGLAGDMASGAKDALKIWSPSRVFKDIGEQIPAGLVAGIEAGAPGAHQGMVDWINDLADDARQEWWRANAAFADELAANGFFVMEDGSIAKRADGVSGVDKGFVVYSGPTAPSGGGISSSNASGGSLLGIGNTGLKPVPWDGTGDPPNGPWYGVGDLVGQSGKGGWGGSAGGTKPVAWDGTGDPPAGPWYGVGDMIGQAGAGGWGAGHTSSAGGTPGLEVGAAIAAGLPTLGAASGARSGGGPGVGSGSSAGGVAGKIDESTQELQTLNQRVANLATEIERSNKEQGQLLREVLAVLQSPQSLLLTVGAGNLDKFIGMLFDRLAQHERRQTSMGGA